MFIFRLSFRLTAKIYPFTVLLFDMSTDVHVQQYTCSFCFFFFGVTCTMTFTSSTWVPTHRSTRKYIYLFTFMLFFRLTTKTYLSPQQHVYMHLDVPVHDPTCHVHTVIPINRLDLPVKVSTAVRVNRCTSSSVYLFCLFLHFRHNMHSYLSTHVLGYVPQILMLFLCLRTNTYLSPQLLVYLPLNVPDHDSAISFSYFKYSV